MNKLPKVRRADGRLASEVRPRGYVTQRMIDQYGSYAKALAALNGEARQRRPLRQGLSNLHG